MFSTKSAFVRGMEIGGSAPVRVQTMYDEAIESADPEDVVRKIYTLSSMGCDLIRFSYVSSRDRENFSYICSHSPIPVVADIHFDYRMALEALDAGADKIRINPGNIGEKWKTKEVVLKAEEKGAAIRIGLNTGSLPRHEKNVDETRLMVDTALEYISDFEAWGFENTVVSLKSSDIEKTMEAAKLFHSLSGYPLHIGVTEAGNAITSSVRSTWALGNLLSSHIGDTLRVSINGKITDEVLAAAEILRAVGLKKSGVRLVACPRCGRHTFDSISFVEEIQTRLLSLDRDITVAVMGCSVNGPGEAHNADYGVTGNGRKIFIYRKGELIKTLCDPDSAKDVLFEVINNDR